MTTPTTHNYTVEITPAFYWTEPWTPGNKGRTVHTTMQATDEHQAELLATDHIYLDPAANHWTTNITKH